LLAALCPAFALCPPLVLTEDGAIGVTAAGSGVGAACTAVGAGPGDLREAAEPLPPAIASTICAFFKPVTFTSSDLAISRSSVTGLDSSTERLGVSGTA
jgi:hypothetical protein